MDDGDRSCPDCPGPAEPLHLGKHQGAGPPGDVFFKVTAKQFNWEITYPGPDGKLGTPDDVTVENDFHVPVNKVVRFELTSKDVIHSFFVPWIRLRQAPFRAAISTSGSRSPRSAITRSRVRSYAGRPFGNEG